MPIKPIQQTSPVGCEKCKKAIGLCILHTIANDLRIYNDVNKTNIFLAHFVKPEVPTRCNECGRNLNGYKGPRCRYCDGTAGD